MPAAHRAPVVEEWLLPTSDGAAELFVTEAGSGPPLVALHGGWAMGHHRALTTPLAHLARTYRLVRYDQRGSGRSGGAAAAISFAAHVADLDTLLGELDGRPVTFVGHSAGSLVAVAYALAHPERVARLVLLAPPPGPPLDPVEERLAAAEADGPGDRLSRPAVRRLLAAEGLDRPESELGARERTRLRLIRFAALNCADPANWCRVTAGEVCFSAADRDRAAASRPPDLDLAALRLDHDVQVLLGDDDPVDPGAVRWRHRAATRPGWRVQVVPHAGHFPWLDRPRAFRAALTTALAGRP